MADVLMVVSAARQWTLTDGTAHPTGFWAEEYLVPYDIFTGAGFDVTVATPGAATPVVDELSLGLTGGILPHTAKKFRARLKELAPVLENPADLHAIADGSAADGAVGADSYDLVFYPGGHGPMEDLATDTASGELLRRRLEDHLPVAMLCHAPAAVLSATDEQGRSPVRGRRMTAFSNLEERLNPYSWKASWLLQDRLEEVGVEYEKAALPMRPHVVVDGTLYTGQNPQSSQPLAERLVADLG